MCVNIKSFIYTHIFCYEGAATLLVFFILYLKLYLGRMAVTLDRKEMYVAIPSEITTLVLGFQLSKIIEDNPVNISNSEGIVKILLSLIILAFQVVSVQKMKDELSGKLELKVKLKILWMYLLSICIYIFEIYGGVK